MKRSQPQIEKYSKTAGTGSVSSRSRLFVTCKGSPPFYLMYTLIVTTVGLLTFFPLFSAIALPF